MPELPKDTTPEELEKLSMLLQLMRQSEDLSQTCDTLADTAKEKPAKKKKKGKKRRSRSQKKQTEQEQEPLQGEEEETPRVRKSKRRVKKSTEHAGTIQASVEQIHIGKRPNNFEVVGGKVVLAGKNLPETAEERKAKQFDKAVSLKHEPTDRREESMVKAQCQGCGRTEMVSEIFLVRDHDTKGYSYTCNTCSMKR